MLARGRAGLPGAPCVPPFANLVHRRAVQPSVDRIVNSEDLLSIGGVHKGRREASRIRCPALMRREVSWPECAAPCMSSIARTRTEALLAGPPPSKGLGERRSRGGVMRRSLTAVHDYPAEELARQPVLWGGCGEIGRRNRAELQSVELATPSTAAGLAAALTAKRTLRRS
jgi:hypothetical protein